MKMSKHVQIGLVVAAVIAVGVAVLAYMHLSAPKKRTVVVAPPKPSNVDEPAARREVDRRLAEYRGRGEPVVVTDFKPKPIDPKQNAAEPLMAAAKWLDTKE